MNLPLSLSFLLLSPLLFGQQYNGLVLEKTRVDKNNRIYMDGSSFVYRVSITTEGAGRYIRSMGAEAFQLTDQREEAQVKEVRLSVMKPRPFQRTNKHQTEICYSYEPEPTFTSNTGLVENEVNCWLHPPRNGFFAALQTCPYPYVKLDQPVGYTWADSMSIANHWADSAWGTWQGRLLLTYDYRIIGTETIRSELGEIPCMVIEATANSAVGRSTLVAHFSNAYGFVVLDYSLFNGTRVKLSLTKVEHGPRIRDAQDFFEKRQAN